MTSTLTSAAETSHQDPPPFHTVVDGVLARLRSTPDRIAVIDGSGAVTAGELDRWSAAVAADLRSRIAAGGPRRIGLDLGRGVRHVVGFLATLRAGCCAVPLDPRAQQRMTRIIDTAGLAAVLTADEPAIGARTATGKVPRLPIDRWRAGMTTGTGADEALVPPDEEAYLLFTSGSTGIPKGVLIPHSALAAFAWSMSRFLGLNDSDRVLALTATTFDPSVMEIFCSLVTGAPLVIAGADERTDPALLQQFCIDHRITYGFFPVAVVPLLEPAALPDLRLLHTGAEAPGPEQVQRWTATGDRRFVNSYGPTETTITVCSLEATGRWSRALPIGRPHGGHTLLIVDADTLQPVVSGDAGELLISGPGLAIGYLDDPASTAAQFLLLDGVRYYRTGDRCRVNPDHTLQFLGRVDRQVKIRGHRIELSEVEAALDAHPAVLSAVADTEVAADGSRRLIAHFTGDVEADTLRQWLADRLLPALVPTGLFAEHDLPLTASDKIDLPALAARRIRSTRACTADVPLAADPGALPRRRSGQAPADDVRNTVLRLWAELVGPPARGDGLYASGGTSVSAMTLVAQVHRTTGRTIRTVEVLRAPDAQSLADLAATRVECTDEGTVEGTVEGTADFSGTPPITVASALPPALSAAQQRLWLTEQISGSSHEANIAVAHRLSGPLDHAALDAALRTLLERHPILRWRFPTRDGRGTVEWGPVPTVVLDRLTCAPGHCTRGDCTRGDCTPGGGTPAEHATLVAGLVRRRFELSSGPLWNATLISHPTLASDGPPQSEQHTLVLTFHHLICDGWSVQVLLDDLVAGYRGAIGTDAATFRPAGSFAAQVIREQTGAAAGGAADERWWAAHLGAAPHVIDLSAPGEPSAPSAVPAVLEQSTALPIDRHGLDLAARAVGGSAAAVLLAAFGIWLRRRTGCDEAVVGFVVAGRDHPESLRTVGMFSEIVPLLLRPAASPTFQAAVMAAEREIADGGAHRAIALQDIARVAGAGRPQGRSSLVQVLFNLYNFPLPVPQFPGLQVTPVAVPASGSPFDLTLYVHPDPLAPDPRVAPLTIRSVLRSDRVDRGDQVTPEFAALLGELLADPQAPLQIAVPASMTIACAVPGSSAATPAQQPSSGQSFHQTGHGRRAGLTVSPATALERAIAAIWSEVLGIEITGVTDNFFDVGGHSMAVADVRAGITGRLQREVSMVDLFTWPTIREIADHLDRTGRTGTGAAAPPTSPAATTSVDRGAARRSAARRAPRSAPQRRER